MPESFHLVLNQIAPDRAFPDSLLKRLVDHAPISREVLLADLQELFKGNRFLDAPTLRVPYSHYARILSRRDLPDSVPAVSAVLLQHPGLSLAHPQGDLTPQFVDC